MAEKPLADIPFSFFEYRAVFREPAFDAWFSRSGLLAAIFRALQDWKVGLDNVTWKSEPSECLRTATDVHFAWQLGRLLGRPRVR